MTLTQIPGARNGRPKFAKADHGILTHSPVLPLGHKLTFLPTKLQRKVRDDDIVKVEAEVDKTVAEVNTLFVKVNDRRQKKEVPDFMFGKISFDPVTRTKLTQDMLIPNYAMKEVVDDFVSKNEWSLYY